MASPNPFDTLDSLFAEVMQAERAKPRVRNAQPEAPKRLTNETYTLPENWICLRAVALMHVETSTVIGTYLEYKHKTRPHTRKLVRTEEPTEVSAVERVSGPQWIHVARTIPDPQISTHQRQITVGDLRLAGMGVVADQADLTVHLAYGGVLRVVLADHTTFHSPDGKTILTLGAGTNVYEVMDLDAKIKLKQELAI